MTEDIFNKVNEVVYVSSTGKCIRQYTGRIQAFYFNNDWVLIDDKNTLIDWDWNLNSLVKRNKLIVNS